MLVTGFSGSTRAQSLTFCNCKDISQFCLEKLETICKPEIMN